MNNLAQDFILSQGNSFAEAMSDQFLEECNQFMINFLDLPKTYVDGNGVEQRTGFNQSYGWAMDREYLLQTSATMTKSGLVNEMSMYQKKVSKYFTIKSTYNVSTEPCEAPEVRKAPEQTVAVPYETTTNPETTAKEVLEGGSTTSDGSTTGPGVIDGSDAASTDTNQQA